MDTSLYKLMRVNRGRFFLKLDPITIIPPIVQPPPSNPPPESPTYTMSDFGENVINNHYPHDSNHSERCQIIFNYITKDFRNRCTSYQSYKTPEIGNYLVFKDAYLAKCALLDADLVFAPYVNAAVGYSAEYYNFILAVGSHYDNDGTDGILHNGDRHDITANAETFLADSIAVAARRDTPEEWNSDVTSYGYGLEFFEDCSPEALDPCYPDKDVPSAFAELLSNDGVHVTSNVHQNFAVNLTVGEQITIRYTQDENTWQTTTVTDIVDSTNIIVSPAITPITNNNIYGWHNVTIGTFIYGQAQSWAVPLVAGKLKVIKMSTGADWDTVRAAARATAKRNLTGIPEIDAASWDIYRGFGCIQVNDAIQYIQNQ